MHRRALLSLIAFALIASSLTGCLAASSGGYGRGLTESVRQTATLPAAQGPFAVGPMLARGRVGLEGSLTTAHATTRESPGADDAADQRTIHTHASARVSYAPTGATELGLTLEAADGRWSTPSAPDSAPVPDGASYLGASVQVRQRVVGGDDLHLGVLGELGVGAVSMTRQIRTTASVGGGPSSLSSGGGMPQSLATVTTEGETFTDTAAVLFPRVGFFVTGSLLPSVHLSVGVLSQLQPYAAPPPSSAARDAWGISYALLATPFFAAAWDVGPVTLFGQLYVNIPEPHGVAAASPFGGTFGARLAL